MIRFEWLRALKQSNGAAFLADGFARYGYLPNPDNDSGLPIGFSLSGPVGSQTVGMTCAACHTRQISVDGKPYRIDGGPAIVDFHALLVDLDAAVGGVLATDDSFAAFAKAVFDEDSPDPEDVAALKRRVADWRERHHTLMSRALPTAGDRPWGLGRVDAIGMIFNRLTGLDIGPPPSFIIAENIKKADAPVRFPFLWNAPRQDRTQWSGFADNGSDLLALSRNLGQVLGVFAVFHPKKEILLVNFLNESSVNFDGLDEIEELVKKIGPPKWPWPVNMELAGAGKAIFERPTSLGGCAECHGIAPGETRFPFRETWRTPVQNVGTDTRQYDILGWTAKSGALQGAFIPFATKPLKETDLAINILATSIIGSIAQRLTGGGPDERSSSTRVAIPGAAPPPDSELASSRLPPNLRELEHAFGPPGAGDEPGPPEAGPRALTPPVTGGYESRVMEGIWATAPYLHNGSVPTLADLLMPAEKRAAKFAVGPNYDREKVGLAASQPGAHERVTTDCSDLNSGDSRCGHEFGTQLPAEEKKALLEYLKTL